MIHPLVRLIATEPHLLAEHASAYAALIGSEARQVKNQWTLRLLLTAATVCCASVAAVLAGVAVMLWAITPALTEQARWALIAAPAIPAAAALIAGLLAQRPSAEEPFATLQEQVAADMRVLKEVGSS